MFYSFAGVKVFYQEFGKSSSRATLLLHGWGRSSQDFENFASAFPNRYFVALDFPPFGKSQTPEDWSIFTYVQMVISLCEHLKITEVDLVGHSFGGRVAILLCAVNRSYVHSCILVGSAGIKPKRKISYFLKVSRYKILKRFGKNVERFGSEDYKALSPQMRKTFVSIVNTHLDAFARTITTPTLIVCGRDDRQTPLYMAKKLNKYIRNSQLEIIENAGHFAFQECPMIFYGIVKRFWEKV